MTRRTDENLSWAIVKVIANQRQLAGFTQLRLCSKLLRHNKTLDLNS